MDSAIKNTIDKLESDVKATREKVALGKSTAKICNSIEWELIFNKGYFTQELNSLTQKLPLVTGEEKELIVGKIAAIGSLKIYIQDLLNQSNQAQEELNSLEIELDHQRGLL